MVEFSQLCHPSRHTTGRGEELTCASAFSISRPITASISAELARALEERGFASLYVPEHTHIPVSRRSPFPAGGELPKKYSHTHDPFVGLSFAAAATEQAAGRHRHLLNSGARPDRHGQVRRQPRSIVRRPFRLWHRRRGGTDRGNGRSRGAVRDPVQADARAHPRNEGVVDAGGGILPWRVREFRSVTGPIRSRRSARTRRSCWVAKAITPCGAWSNIASGWIPRPVGDFTPRGAMDRLRRMAEEKGRDPKSLSISVFRAPPEKAALAEYREAGIDEALLEIPDLGPDEILQLLDRYSPLAAA